MLSSFCLFAFCINVILAQESINLSISFSTFTTLFAVSLVNLDSYTFRNRDGKINYLKLLAVVAISSVMVKMIEFI